MRCIYLQVEDFVAKRTLELCEKQHLTMYRLAQLSGLKQSTISNIIKQKTLPNLITIDKMCSGFGITLSQFFLEEDGICVSLTDDQKQIVDIWMALDNDKKKFVKTVLQGMLDAE